VLFCEPLRGYRLIKDEVPDEEYTVPFGSARLVRDGTDVALVAWSAAVSVASAAAELASAQGHLVRSARPAHAGAARRPLARRTGGPDRPAVVVHEAPLTGGFGAEVVATIQEEAFWSLAAPVRRVTAYDTPYPIASIEQHYIPSAERVLDAVQRATGER
jgi:pyruvate dehydrogenase E1 component beta subunit